MKDRTGAAGPAARAVIRALSLLLFALPTLAQTQGGTVDAMGAALAQRGAGAVPACMGCHGANGEGQAAAAFPRLAGLSAGYLNRQLEAYVQGFRQHPVMEPIAKQMSAAQRVAASRYYASLGASSGAANTASTALPSAAAASAAVLVRGRRLADEGDETKQVQACANCHGPGGIGSAPNYPALAGQHASYLVQALERWKDGSRRTDASRQMPQIAQRLGPEDMQAVAAYYASRQPPAAMGADRLGPRAMATAVPPGRTVIVSGPRPRAGAAAAPSGQGTEQGSPLQGGSQFGSDPRSGTGAPGTPPASGSGAAPATPAASAPGPQTQRP